MSRKPLTVEEALTRCALPAIVESLEAIASGRIIVSIDHKTNCGYLEELDGEQARDPEFPSRKMLVAGIYTLFTAGLLDTFGLVTDKGVAFLHERMPRRPS